MKQNRRSGFTLVEVLIVVVIMAVLAATIVPQFSDSTNDAKVSTGIFNLHTLRSQIQLYKSQHDGKTPTATLDELISKTDKTGTIGTGATHVYGPYIATLPENPFTGSNKVRVSTSATAPTASGATDAGWLYHAASGNIWIDHADYLAE